MKTKLNDFVSKRTKIAESNMSYVMFENTYNDLQDVLEKMDEYNFNFDDLSKSEQSYYRKLFNACHIFIATTKQSVKEFEDQLDEALRFNNEEDKWFTLIAKDKETCSKWKETAVDRIVNLAPYKENLDKLETALADIKLPGKKELLSFIENINTGAFKGEFRFKGGKDGKSSQVKEFFSLLKQAIHYHDLR